MPKTKKYMNDAEFSQLEKSFAQALQHRGVNEKIYALRFYPSHV